MQLFRLHGPGFIASWRPILLRHTLKQFLTKEFPMSRVALAKEYRVGDAIVRNTVWTRSARRHDNQRDALPALYTSEEHDDAQLVAAARSGGTRLKSWFGVIRQRSCSSPCGSRVSVRTRKTSLSKPLKSVLASSNACFFNVGHTHSHKRSLDVAAKKASVGCRVARRFKRKCRRIPASRRGRLRAQPEQGND